MKKKHLVKTFFALLLLGLIVSCDSGGPSNNHILLRIKASPYVLSSSGSTPYGVSVYLSDQSATGYGDFSGVVINVNGAEYSDTLDSTNNFSTGSIVDLAEGDTMTVTLTHPSFGTVSYSQEVPPALSGETISPDFPARGVANTESSYTVSWPQIAGVDDYYAVTLAYSDDQGDNRERSFSENFTPSTYTFDVTDSGNNPYPYLQLYIQSRSYSDISDFSSESFFTIAGPDMPLYINYN